MFFFPVSSRHECTPIPLEEVKYYSYTLSHSEHKAGYDQIKYSWKVSECPVCNMRYYYDKKSTGIVEFVPYVEAKKN